MSQQREDVGFIVVGISKKVRNDDPAAIGALWEAFRKEDLNKRIGAEASKEIYCVYHDYEGGFMDPYRMTIGYRVPNSVPTPDGLHRSQVPSQRVVVYNVKGPQPEALVSQWQAIWNGDLNRSYLADYDIYNPNDPEAVSVVVGLQMA